MTTRTNVSQRIIELLEAEGIRTLFGIPDPGFARMHHEAAARGWDVIAPHHEQAGAFMADALSRMTGKPAVIVGNQGPGVANLVPAAICAAISASPCPSLYRSQMAVVVPSESMCQLLNETSSPGRQISGRPRRCALSRCATTSASCDAPARWAARAPCSPARAADATAR